MLFSSFASLLALAAVGANAHGYVSVIKADGKEYKGGIPNETNPKSPIRSIKTIDPYKQVGGPGITCGEGAKAGALVAPITAGSKMTLQWIAHPNDKWPHEMGPMITYMAKVPAGQTADKVDPAKLDFFKVQEHGLDPENKGKWFVERQMKLGTDYVVNVPKAIEDGDYIMRHEIIALHLADKVGGAEFYSSCFQLRVKGGTGSGAVTPTAKFPGEYTAKNPGIFTPNVFNRGFKYTFPGPRIPSFVAGSGPDNSTEPDAKPTESAEPTATTSSTDPEPTEDCDDEDPAEECTDEEPVEDEEPAVTESVTSTQSAKGSKPTGKKHNDYRRAQAAARGWSSRMERRYVGSSRS